MLRTLRDLATGARQQLRDELGPEFADVDLRSLNPRTALQRAILGDEDEWREADPRRVMRNLFEDEPSTAPADEPVSMTKAPQRPLGRGEEAPFDPDAT
jgi:sec-independent protein translocase protein TatB